MIKKEVPIYLQNKDSFECGIKCSKMILKYYNCEHLFSKLESEISLENDSSDIVDLANFFLQNGFNVEFNVFSSYFFNLSHINMSQNKLKNFFETKFVESKDFEWMINIIKFMELGGKINISIHNRKSISDFLLNDYLIIALGTTLFMDKKSTPSTNFHFITLTGFINDKVYFNDPIVGKSSTSFENIIYSLHSISYDGFNSGSFISIKKEFK
jgi:hypothetical protein